MVRRYTPVLLVSLLALSACGRVERPNIIFLMADDLGWADLGVYGNEILHTPRLDRMAAEGQRFTQAYAGASVCGPSRCALMTGMHGGHCRFRDNLARRPGKGREARLISLRPEDRTVAEVLRELGYATGAVGKWGLGGPGSSGLPDSKGFDSFFGFLDQLCAHDHFPKSLFRNQVEEVIEANQEGKKGAYANDLFIDEALAFIDAHQAEPFFLYAALTLPHLKWQVPDLGRWEGSDLPRVGKHYAAMVEWLDTSVGRLLDHLDDRGLSERTIVFFTSDNGSYAPLSAWFGSHADLRGQKSQVYEAGIRVPMLVRWPGTLESGVVSDAVWSHVDFLATAVDLAGGEEGPESDGVSLLPTFLGREQSLARPLYWEVHRPFAQAVRRGRWKAIRFGTLEPVALYDLEADRSEAIDLAADRPELARQMAALLDAERSPTPDWPAAKRANPSRTRRAMRRARTRSQPPPNR